MNVLRITKENATFQIMLALKTNRQKRVKRGEIFVEGVAAINAARAAGIPAIWIAHAEGSRLSGWARDTIEQLRPESLLVLSNLLMAELSDRSDPSELIVVFRRPAETLDGLALGETPLVVVLDRPSNPGNFGSILRSADAFGTEAIVSTGHGADLYDPVAIRASLGAVFYRQVVHEPSSRALTKWFDRLRHEYPGLAVIGTDSAGDRSLRECRLSRPLVLLFGNEATGLSETLRGCVDSVVAIPIEGNVNSLNLASAASIILYSVSGDPRSSGGPANPARI